MSRAVLGWWFGGDTLPNGDGRPIEVGSRLRVAPPVELCKRGLHGSRRVLDALSYYANGDSLWRVRHSGTIVEGDDKLVSSMRTHLVRIDAEEILSAFARRCALRVAHLWDMPDVVREYLETGDRSLRDAARAAAFDAERDAARAAAWAAARAAAWAAAWAAERDAARDDMAEDLESVCLSAIGGAS